MRAGCACVSRSWIRRPLLARSSPPQPASSAIIIDRFRRSRSRCLCSNSLMPFCKAHRQAHALHRHPMPERTRGFQPGRSGCSTPHTGKAKRECCHSVQMTSCGTAGMLSSSLELHVMQGVTRSRYRYDCECDAGCAPWKLGLGLKLHLPAHW